VYMHICRVVCFYKKYLKFVTLDPDLKYLFVAAVLDGVAVVGFHGT
jgi:hypothetical protein